MIYDGALSLGLMRTRWTQINLQFGHDFCSLLFGDLRQKVRHQILLPALPEHHAVNRKCPSQLIEAVYVPTERQRRDMPLYLCGTWEKPKRHEVILASRTTIAPERKGGFPNIRVTLT